MAVTNFDEAFYVIGQARTVLERHNSMLNKCANGRTDFDLAMVGKPEGFNSKAVGNTLKEIHRDVVAFERRIVNACAVDSFAEFKRVTLQAQTQLGEVIQFFETIDTTQFYLDIYQRSGIGPQNLNGEVYIAEEKRVVLDNIKLQYETALAILLETASLLDIGDVSHLELPPAILIPTT